MIPNIAYPYREFDDVATLPTKFSTGDHLGGFDERLHNVYFARLNDHAMQCGVRYTLLTEQIFSPEVTRLYPGLDLRFDKTIFEKYGHWSKLQDYRTHPQQTFEHFLCSFNRSPHVGRKLLVAALDRWGWFCPETCSKNFSHTIDVLDGHIQDLTLDRSSFWRKFFIGDHSEEFFQKIYSFGGVAHVKDQHDINIYNLDDRIAKSFVQIIPESMSTSHYPFVTEKFLYSVVTRGLFLAYGQPGWHQYLESYFGFRPYTQIFDYRFDSIQHPIERLIELLCMLSRFARLDSDEWRDLYQMEIDTIEFNYDHYFSGRYHKHLDAAIQARVAVCP